MSFSSPSPARPEPARRACLGALASTLAASLLAPEALAGGLDPESRLPGARVTEVAMEVGFETLSHFNLSFRKFCECSPSEYIRRRGRALRAS